MTYETIKRFKKRCPSVQSRSEIFTILKDDVSSLFSLCHFLYEKYGDGNFVGGLSAGIYFGLYTSSSTSCISGYDYDAIITLCPNNFVQLFRIDD